MILLPSGGSDLLPGFPELVGHGQRQDRGLAGSFKRGSIRSLKAPVAAQSGSRLKKDRSCPGKAGAIFLAATLH
jgi:hypothetical protein